MRTPALHPTAHLNRASALLFDSSPPAFAYTAKPMTDVEIDAHPDRARLWATIMAFRKVYVDEVDTEVDAVRDAADDARDKDVEQADADGVREGLSQARELVTDMRLKLSFDPERGAVLTLSDNTGGDAGDRAAWEEAFDPLRADLEVQIDAAIAAAKGGAA